MKKIMSSLPQAPAGPSAQDWRGKIIDKKLLSFGRDESISANPAHVLDSTTSLSYPSPATVFVGANRNHPFFGVVFESENADSTREWKSHQYRIPVVPMLFPNRVYPYAEALQVNDARKSDDYWAVGDLPGQKPERQGIHQRLATVAALPEHLVIGFRRRVIVHPIEPALKGEALGDSSYVFDLDFHVMSLVPRSDGTCFIFAGNGSMYAEKFATFILNPKTREIKAVPRQHSGFPLFETPGGGILFDSNAELLTVVDLAQKKPLISHPRTVTIDGQVHTFTVNHPGYSDSPMCRLADGRIACLYGIEGLSGVGICVFDPLQPFPGPAAFLVRFPKPFLNGGCIVPLSTDLVAVSPWQMDKRVIHIYDLKNPAQPLNTIKVHEKDKVMSLGSVNGKLVVLFKHKVKVFEPRP